MRIIIFFIFLVSLSFLQAEWIELHNRASADLFEHRSDSLNEIEINFYLDGFEQEQITVKEESYTRISHPTEGKFMQEGKPDLPCFTRLFAIPDDGTVQFQINSIQQEVWEDIVIFPLQEGFSDSKEYSISQIDRSFYEGNDVFPIELVEIGSPVIMRDIRMVSVTINPFRYDPADRALNVITDLELTVTTDTSERGENPRNSARRLSRIFEPIYKSSIQNYEELLSNRDNVYQYPCYLFIYPNVANLLDNLQYLADWKKQMGYEVHLASTSETGVTNTSIKSYIQNAYDNWENPPEFVCFIGDANGSIVIPTFFESSGEGDNPYGMLEGNDILADVILGRISISSLNELQTYIAKVLNYEKTPYLGNTDWFSRAVLVGDPSSSGPSTIYVNQFIREMIEFYNPNFDFYEYYSGNYSGGMSSSLNNGVTYLNYRGYIGMSGFGNSQINSLNNGFMLPYAVFLTCDTGTFASTYSIARSEAFIRAGTPSQPKGAIAAVGTATSSTHTAFNNAVDTGLFYGIFVDKIYHPGGALQRGKLHLYNSFPNNPNGWVNKFNHWNTLMGDPGVQLWTGQPQPLTVTYNSQVNIGSNFLEVTITDNAGVPVENAWVCALLEGVFFERDYTDAQGCVLLPIEPSNIGTADLTVTAHNFIPHLGSFNVIQSDTFVNVNNYIIDDDNNGTSSGNGDGQINPGESIELKVGLKNFGSLTANDVTAVISSDTPFITITDDEVTFGNIGAGNTNYSVDDFDFDVASNVVGGSEIRLDMQIEDNGGNQWQDHIFLVVQGANLHVQSYLIDDNNNILDPGDTVDLIVTLFNTGSVIASGLEGMLSCSNQFVSLNDSLAVFENISSGQTGNNSGDAFNISLDVHAISGMQIPFNILLTNANGFEQTVSFLIDVGTVTSSDPLGPDAYGYYAYDSTDETYDQVPMYNWIEIDPAYGGSGTMINLYDTGDGGDVADVNLPFSFNFYGVNYDLISVCSNGWIAPGGSSQASYMNSQIPAAQGPSPMIAPFWDDLKMAGGHVYYYHDLMEHAFIIQWSRVQTDFTNSLQNFQVLIYDPAVYPTTSGDAIIVFQYDTVNNTSSGNYGGYPMQHGQYATVGLEDHTCTRGLEYTFNNTYPAAAAPLQNGLAIKFTTEGGGAQAPPVLSLNPISFDFVLAPGSSDTQILEITNEGEANLIYSIEKSYVGYSEETGRGHGGPDDFGHQWFDSDEPNGPQYNWRDITGIATQVTFGSSNTGTDLIPIGFDFYFYGTYYSDFRINPNGWIGFGEDNEESNNLSLPHPWAPKPAIMPFWDDLDPLSGGSVFYYSTADSLVVWFNDVEHSAGNYSGTYDFQLLLYTNGDILFQYRNMSGDTNSATIGIQNENASDALQVTYNGNFVQNEFAVMIKKIVDWLQLYPSYGYIEQGQTEQISIEVSAEELIPDHFTCYLIITTNDVGNPVVSVPVNLQVSSEFPQIEVSVDLIDFGEIAVGQQAVEILTISNVGNAALDISDLTFSNDAFSTDTTSLTILPETSEELNIFFNPTQTGFYEAFLTIFSNDFIHPEMEIELWGEGTQTGNDDIPEFVTAVQQNYPNPFNPNTTIEFSLAETGNVSLIVYNIKGKKVKTLVNGILEPQNYSVSWNSVDDDGKQLSSGVYLYSFKTENISKMMKMLLIK